MIRSMSAALSGMRAHQTMLDVVGNNISNVSTAGFKSSSVEFQDVLTQVITGARAPGAQTAGTNPGQIGLGVRVAGIIQTMTQGALQTTGRASDMSVQGDGFFVLAKDGRTSYTRAGDFSLDAQSHLSSVDGGLVQGWQADPTGTIDTNQPVGNILIRVGDQLAPHQTEAVRLGGNIPADAAIGDQYQTAVTAYDEQGNSILLQLTFDKTAINTWTATASYGTPATAVALADGALTFDGAGELTGPVDHVMDIAAGDIPGFPNGISFNLGGSAEPGRVTQYSGKRSLVVTEQDGFSPGTLESYTVSVDGSLVGTYSNGRTQAIAQVALAVFGNPAGLERAGGVWFETTNSGLPQVGTAATGGRGRINPGALEMSNVDLAQEFTNLIIAQRGFQANSRVITTSDELLQEIVNLKRG